MAERRPNPFIVEYAAQDVLVLLLLLERCMASKFSSQGWADRVKEECNARLELSRSEEYLSSAGKLWAAPQKWEYRESRSNEGMIHNLGGHLRGVRIGWSINEEVVLFRSRAWIVIQASSNG